MQRAGTMSMGAKRPRVELDRAQVERSYRQLRQPPNSTISRLPRPFFRSRKMVPNPENSKKNYLGSRNRDQKPKNAMTVTLTFLGTVREISYIFFAKNLEIRALTHFLERCPLRSKSRFLMAILFVPTRFFAKLKKITRH